VTTAADLHLAPLDDAAGASLGVAELEGDRSLGNFAVFNVDGLDTVRTTIIREPLAVIS